MPAAPVRKTPVWAWLLLILCAGLLAYCLFCVPQAFALLGVIVFLVGIQYIWEERNRQRLAIERSGETICAFARSFKRGTDTWILRAVYEEVSKFLAVGGKPLPVRAEDDCEKDLNMDSEVLDYLAYYIASRSGRSMVDTKSNPLYGKVRTVRDIVNFMENQQRVLFEQNS